MPFPKDMSLEDRRAKSREYAAKRLAANPEAVKAARKEANLRWKEKNYEEYLRSGRERAARWREANPEKTLELQRAFYERHKDQRRAEARDYHNRVRAADRDTKYAEQAGRPRAAACEVCAVEGKTVFDHCHASGKFRGWLCDRCNRTLGQVKDNTEILKKLIAYLDNPPGPSHAS